MIDVSNNRECIIAFLDYSGGNNQEYSAVLGQSKISILSRFRSKISSFRMYTQDVNF